MKKVIIFNIIYHIFLFLLPLIVISIIEGYGSEMFGYTLYFSIRYLIIGFIFDCSTLAALEYFKIKRFKWSLFALGSAIIFLITFYGLIQN